MTWFYIVGYLLIGVIVGAVGIAILDFDTDEQWGWAILSSVAWPLAILGYVIMGLAAVTRLLGNCIGNLPRKIRRRKRE